LIFDKKENLSLYKGISENLDDALDYLMKSEFEGLEDKWKYVYGQRVFLKQTDIVTIHPDPAKYRYEYHKKHIDIHYLLYGLETIFLADLEKLKKEEQFDAKEDFGFATGDFLGSITLSPGDFMVCFPNDAHRPWIGDGDTIRKILIKVAIL
jgi:biofilm protein TabA